MKSGTLLVVITVILVVLVAIVVAIVLFKRNKSKKIAEEVSFLDREKNLIASTPVLDELSKVETIVKNDKMEEKYKRWQHRFEMIKDDQITKINDMLIELDLSVTTKNYKEYRVKVAQTELEIYKAKTAVDHLMSDIKEITVSEEKYRAIIIKLKAKYRELSNHFQTHKKDYEEVQAAIDLQFENIEKRFLEFEKAMENNEYTEVVHIVKALDNMIDHMTIVIQEVPDLILLSSQLIPKKLDEIERIYADMIDHGYPLNYLKIPYNVEESRKNVTGIIDRIKVLNLEGCMFELKTILGYLDSTFEDFEKEKVGRRVYENNAADFETKLKKVNHLVGDIYKQMDDIKKMYDLTDDDIQGINDVRSRLLAINTNYKEMTEKLNRKEVPYSKTAQELETVTNLLQQLEEDLDISLKSLGSMYDDELRAREQLDEIQVVLKQCKIRIRSYKLPIIMNEYFVELSEANEAILEIIKELEKKPIEIKVLNTRVDTARDLVLKLFHTTNEMIRTAQLAEMAIVYGNRYRSSYVEIHNGLSQAEVLFYKGNYKNSLEMSLHVLSFVEPDVENRFMEVARSREV